MRIYNKHLKKLLKKLSTKIPSPKCEWKCSLGCWVGLMKTAKTRESRIIYWKRGFSFWKFDVLYITITKWKLWQPWRTNTQATQAQSRSMVGDATFWAAKVVWAKIIIVRIIKCSFDQSDLDYRVIITFSCWGKESSALQLNYLSGGF